MLRDLINALGKASMYPPGHRFISESAGVLVERISAAMADRDAITIGIPPRGLLVDGVAVDPLPGVLREFGARMHRKNVGTIYLRRSVTAHEVGTLLAALSAADADEQVGRQGLRLDGLRVEPLVYDVLTYADPLAEGELDDVFWMSLVEAAFGRRMADGETMPNSAQIADAISERAAQSADGARRVYEALAAFSSALTTRSSDRSGGSARKRFVEVLSALSRPTTTRVVEAAPSSTSRRRFLRDTLELVPPALLLQVLESVAEADGEPISPQLRWLLGKLAGGEEGRAGNMAAFTTEVLGLVEQWDGTWHDVDEAADYRLGLEPARILALGLEVAVASPSVLEAGRRQAAKGQLLDVLQQVDHPDNDPGVARAVADAVLDPGLLERLLGETTYDYPLLERVVQHVGVEAATPLLDALGRASERSTRRRLLDLIVRIGPDAEPTLLGKLPDAPWYLVRNILAALAQFPAIRNTDAVFAFLADSEPRVRQEALRVLIRQPRARERAMVEAIDSGDDALARIVVAALGSECPPRLVGSVATLLARTDPEIQLQAIRALGNATSPVVVPHLLVLVRARRGIFRRQRLLATTPVMLAALELLARRWGTHRPVVTTMQLARRSNDPEVRAVITGAPA